MMRERFPLVILCPIRGEKNRTCSAAAQYETYNLEQQHAFYRCIKPECKGMSVVCYNEEHVQ